MKVTVSHAPTATDGGIWKRSDLDSGKKISFEMWGGGVFWERSDLDSGKKIRVLKFGGGVFWKVKTQSAKIHLNFNFQGGVLEKVRFGLRKEN